ncbi:hypothetical protein GCM10010219_24890 [Streptomyces netropsis]|nr:hypothetical protein GCM10010219_24890 [Streptomyces netropsis]
MNSAATMACTSVTAMTSTARTAESRTGSGILGRLAGSSTHNGLRAYGRMSRSWSMTAHLPHWLPRSGRFQKDSKTIQKHSKGGGIGWDTVVVPSGSPLQRAIDQARWFPWGG